ncbi:MAG: TonB-dependent receptor SusC [Polaribacter sejongensis]|nr:MAG: TonB-dependent receptor SusC [Polaribacter sejongensis]
MIKKILLLGLIAFSSVAMVAQTIVTGTVTDLKKGDTLPGANIKISRKAVGTTTDFDGNFVLNVADKPPFTIEISVLGFKTEKVEILNNNQKLDIGLTENETSLDEIVVSASRTPERIMESPVSIERMDTRAIKNTSAPSFYDGLENLKGVDVNTNSLTFKSVNTRGFATFSNTRFMQLVDGMDNAAPGLNFAIGNLLGMSELDVKTVELLPGASSALYGANAFNGILFMTSKSPFDDQGISFSYKQGITSQEAAGDNNFHDVNIRMAYAFSDKFAAKATLSYLEGTDWYATDDRNTDGDEYISGDRSSDPNYNGVNVFGDVASTDLGGAIGEVSRTGYDEKDLIDYGVKSIKFGTSLNYRPFGDDRLEVIWNSKIGTGDTQYLGGQKYSIKNFYLDQHRLEVKGKNFFVRGYTTRENAGDSYNTLFAALNINRAWKSDEDWFRQYAAAYLGAIPGVDASSHAAARAVADTGRFLPGSTEFETAFNTVISDPDLKTGAKFRDETKLYHADGNYNFRDVVDFAEIQVGGSYRRYALNSFGNIFTDGPANGAINYDEYGVYTQAQKSFLDEDRLKVTASIRYDKAQNFEGNFSPRVSFAFAGGENKNNNFRASFQTGFRNPTTQDQYIGLDVGSAILLGGVEDNLDRFTTTFVDNDDGNTYTVTGRDAYENSYTVASGGTVKADVSLVKPEKVTAYEIGYRGLVKAGTKRVTLDVSVYYNQYEDFIANRNVIVPYNLTGGFKIFQLYSNTSTDINSYGATAGLNTKILKGFDLGLNYTYAEFEFDQASDPDFEAGFNTPAHKVKLQFGKTNLFKNFGFNFNARWQDKYRWESTFVDGTINARTVLDAQINYSVPSMKSVFKLGGANLSGKEYLSAPGVGAIGSQYYLSWTINN